MLEILRQALFYATDLIFKRLFFFLDLILMNKRNTCRYISTYISPHTHRHTHTCSKFNYFGKYFGFVCEWKSRLPNVFPVRELQLCFLQPVGSAHLNSKIGNINLYLNLTLLPYKLFSLSPYCLYTYLHIRQNILIQI